MHVVVAGKGGVGKSVVAATLARILARRGDRVLALDSDLMPGLTLSLGADAPPQPPLLDAVERPEGGRWRLRRGIGPVRAVERYATEAPDGVRLLQAGKTPAEGIAPIHGALSGFYEIVQRLDRVQHFRQWSIVGDLSAGPRQSAYRWDSYAETMVLLVEPTWKSALGARRIALIASSRRGVAVRIVANKVRDPGDVRQIEQLTGKRVFASIPFDEDVVAADRLGRPLLDHAPHSAAVAAIEQLADKLAA